LESQVLFFYCDVHFVHNIALGPLWVWTARPFKITYGVQQKSGLLTRCAPKAKFCVLKLSESQMMEPDPQVKWTMRSHHRPKMRNVSVLYCLLGVSLLQLSEGAAIASPIRSHHHPGGLPTVSLAQRTATLLVPVGKGAAGVAVGFFGYRLAIRSIKKTVGAVASAIIV
jgi:hypothetical protein